MPGGKSHQTPVGRLLRSTRVALVDLRAWLSSGSACLIAVRLAERALALEPDDHPVQYNVACVYALLGEANRALDLLERTMPGASTHRWAWLAQDSDFDPLRSHPRFEALLRRHGPGA